MFALEGGPGAPGEHGLLVPGESGLHILGVRGEGLAELGGVEIGNETLLRWYVLHVIMLPFVIIIFMAIHFWRVRKDGGISGPL